MSTTDLTNRPMRAFVVILAIAFVIEVRSTVGGGSLPGETIPSAAVAVNARSPDRLLAALRRGDPAVIGRIEDGSAVFDLRTVEPVDDDALLAALRPAIQSAASSMRRGPREAER